MKNFDLRLSSERGGDAKRCPECDHRWVDHSTKDAGCLRDSGRFLCMCKRDQPKGCSMTGER